MDKIKIGYAKQIVQFSIQYDENGVEKEHVVTINDTPHVQTTVDQMQIDMYAIEVDEKYYEYIEKSAKLSEEDSLKLFDKMFDSNRIEARNQIKFLTSEQLKVLVSGLRKIIDLSIFERVYNDEQINKFVMDLIRLPLEKYQNKGILEVIFNFYNSQGKKQTAKVK
jgi:hypothetical protein